MTDFSEIRYLLHACYPFQDMYLKDVILPVPRWRRSPATNKQCSGHQLSVLQFNSVLTLSTQRHNQITQVKSSGLQACPPPSSLNLGLWMTFYHLCFWSPATDWKFPGTPSLSSVNFPEQSQNSEKHLTYKITGLLQKDQPDGRNTQGKVCGKEHGTSIHSFSQHATFPTSPHVHQPGGSMNKVLLGF